MNDVLTSLPSLGAGLGYRPALGRGLYENRAEVDFVEVIADHYLDATKRKLDELRALRRDFTIVPHAINLSLGSADGIDHDYLGKLKALLERLDPPWWSEHVAFTRSGGVEVGHLCPLPRTAEAVDVFCRNVETVRSHIDVPLILENITYVVDVPGAEMSEGEFLTAILERLDCGMLLDVTNLYTNSVNHDFDAYRMLDELPLDRVVQLHFVGGHTRDGLLIDSHGYATPDEVWELMEAILNRAPVKGAILERDFNFPPFAELAAELARVREIGKQVGQWA